MNSPTRTTTFHLEGPQTVRTIEITCDRLREELAHHDAVAIRCGTIAEVDLSFVQLLLAAKRSADRAGKSLTLATPVAEGLRAALDQAGVLAGPRDSADETLWLREMSAR